MPQITVVVPVYQAGPFLLPCLRSLSAQSFCDWEAVLVDDGSTDGSADACDRYAEKDGRCRVLHQKNAGPSAARAAGVAAAKGEYVAFLDCDDLLHPDFLQTLYTAARHSGLPLACCRYTAFFSELPAREAPPAQYTRLISPEHLAALLQDHRVDYSLCNKLYARTLFAPGDFGRVAYNEDLLANWRLFWRARGLAFCDFSGYYYRQHPESASHAALSAQSVRQQWAVAHFVRHTAQGTALQPVAQAFYYEKLTYLYSMIARQPNAGALAQEADALRAALRKGFAAARQNPLLAGRIKLAAAGSLWGGGVYRAVCRRLLRDRQSG